MTDLQSQESFKVVAQVNPPEILGSFTTREEARRFIKNYSGPYNPAVISIEKGS